MVRLKALQWKKLEQFTGSTKEKHDRERVKKNENVSGWGGYIFGPKRNQKQEKIKSQLQNPL
jgi:hypothetical protein